VLCFDASRLARNGRDWHNLLELCGLVEARVIDLDGVYDPCRPNDRLLLGIKGSISEFELGVLRARMLDAARAKARRSTHQRADWLHLCWHAAMRRSGIATGVPDRDLKASYRVAVLVPPTRVSRTGVRSFLIKPASPASPSRPNHPQSKPRSSARFPVSFRALEVVGVLVLVVVDCAKASPAEPSTIEPARTYAYIRRDIVILILSPIWGSD
jgi:Resolvase, N terminal domain